MDDHCAKTKSAEQKNSGCCEDGGQTIDLLLWIPLTLVVFLYLIHVAIPSLPAILYALSNAVVELINTMFVGLVVGVMMVAVLSYLPRELVLSALGSGQGFKGLCRATLAGVLLDLCSHGILMVGAKLYERGVSTGQVMAFLVASPWNSLSLTIILVAFIGLAWTLVFIVLSVVVALVTGAIFDALVARGSLPMNPNSVVLPKKYAFWPKLVSEVRSIELSLSSLSSFIITGVRESRTVIRWLLIGVLLAALIRTFVAHDVFATYFGPTIVGLALTMVAATVIEVCSEGATPIAADIFNRADAPGNSFAFLMAGVSTDYTEIMVLKETTRSWRLALFLPLVTLPQIVLIAAALNL